MKILILGGDGFCGWPTVLHLSNLGFEITIVDNLSRRKIDNELKIASLTPIQSIKTRLDVWKKLTGQSIQFYQFDIAENYHALHALLGKLHPDVIVHFAEQRAAPYSVKNAKNKRYTISNNINTTHNLLVALVELNLDPHVIHMGTMGVYGYGVFGKIPEGYLKIKCDETNGATHEILYPAHPGSIYHLTKAQDQLLFAYYNKTDGIRITDLHQGIVWGTQTEQTRMDEHLINRFDYDGDYGTVLNRFLMQAAIDYPLTVHGSGGQKRAFINLQDTVRCIEHAIKNPPLRGARVQIINQMTETHRVLDLAKRISDLTGTPIQHLPNPRVEADANELEVENANLLSFGLNPITLQNEDIMREVNEIKKYSSNIDKNKIICVSQWRQFKPKTSELIE